MRRGSGILEAMVALTLLSLLAMPLIDAGRTNAGAAEAKMALLLRRQAADALMNRVIARPLAELRPLRGGPRPAPSWVSVDAPGTDAVQLTFEEDVDGRWGLARVTLELTPATGHAGVLRLVRLVRKEI